MEETSPRERFCTGVFIAIVHNIASQLNKRREAYKNFDIRFKILQNLEEKNSKEVACEAKLLGEVYMNDIDGQDLNHSFSALKRVKSENIRSSMVDEKLNGLLLLCTQIDIILKLDYKNIIDDFATRKTRKKLLYESLVSLVVSQQNKNNPKKLLLNEYYK
ncbi:hypothetical protein J6590_057754 [Homalodisca vitripennis]|nr:hypothetical protein J6590_057754 [Homalodisca vitripennis]